jgi:predicted TIM-barrel fold metal-dependent hydrolase
MQSQSLNIGERQVKDYLSRARSIKSSNQFYDIHVHPLEIVFLKYHYHKNPAGQDVYSAGSSAFTPPRITDILLEDQNNNVIRQDFKLSPAICCFKLSALYSHTGPGVFKEHMELSGIDKLLLLPVASKEGSIETQMTEIEKIFPEEGPFYRGWSVSNDLVNEEILDSAKDAVKRYKIRAIKQNLSQAEIDITSSKGRMRLEAIMDVCRQLQLPIIFHSGKSPLAGDTPAANYCTIDVFKNFDWQLTPNPVVFAHAASYGCEIQEIKNHVIPILKQMMKKYDHLFIDTSGVDHQGLALLLKEIPIERIVFGSDALYEPQWQRMVKLLFVLDNISSNVEADFLKIMSVNPEKNIFKHIKT